MTERVQYSLPFKDGREVNVKLSEASLLVYSLSLSNLTLGFSKGEDPFKRMRSVCVAYA